MSLTVYVANRFSGADEDADTSTVRCLLAAGADAHARGTGRWSHTPLFYAVMHPDRGGDYAESRHECARVLLRARADVRADDNVALRLAVSMESVPLVARACANAPPRVRRVARDRAAVAIGCSRQPRVRALLDAVLALAATARVCGVSARARSGVRAGRARETPHPLRGGFRAGAAVNACGGLHDWYFFRER